MENMISLAIVIVVFLGLLIPVAYVADALAGQVVKWLNVFVPNCEE